MRWRGLVAQAFLRRLCFDGAEDLVVQRLRDVGVFAEFVFDVLLALYGQRFDIAT